MTLNPTKADLAEAVVKMLALEFPTMPSTQTPEIVEQVTKALLDDGDMAVRLERLLVG